MMSHTQNRNQRIQYCRPERRC